jgi:Trp operon repressor
LFQKYLRDVKKDELSNKSAIPELDWTKLEALMNNNNTSPQCINLTTSSCCSSNNDSPSSLSEQQQHLPSQHSQHWQQQPWRDVTLFYGVLQDVMTVSEQEFLTQLFTSGQPDLVAQAAHIVQGILNMSMQQRQHTKSNTSSNSTTTTTKKVASMSPKKLVQLRGRFPLPKHMPLCVALPVYDPTSRSPLLSFESPPPASRSKSCQQNELIVARVHGPAGRLGLRRGDVVTHVQGGCEPVPDRAAWDAHLQQLLQSSSSSPTAAAANQSSNSNNNSTLVTLVVVNANAETATALRERAIQMQRELKHW